MYANIYTSMSSIKRVKTERGLTISSLAGQPNHIIAQKIVQDQIRIIDAGIESAHASGFNQFEYTLPTNFCINSLSKSDAQTLIYSELLMLYNLPEDEGGKGFEHTYIGIRSNATVLVVSWRNNMDLHERDIRRDLIRRYTKKLGR